MCKLHSRLVVQCNIDVLSFSIHNLQLENVCEVAARQLSVTIHTLSLTHPPATRKTVSSVQPVGFPFHWTVFNKRVKSCDSSFFSFMVLRPATVLNVLIVARLKKTFGKRNVIAKCYLKQNNV